MIDEGYDLHSLCLPFRDEIERLQVTRQTLSSNDLHGRCGRDEQVTERLTRSWRRDTNFDNREIPVRECVSQSDADGFTSTCGFPFRLRRS
jgi:hypothetical protein